MEILTPRFVLRDFTGADRAAFLAYHADPRGHAFHGPEASDPALAARLFDTFRGWAAERPRRNHQLAIVQRRHPHALVGCGGLRREGAAPGEADLGIELAPDVWGRFGYAIEVGRALLDAGFGRLGLVAITGSTVSANDRVQRLARWFGADVTAAAVRPGEAWVAEAGWSDVHWRITAAQWAARRAARHPAHTR